MTDEMTSSHVVVRLGALPVWRIALEEIIEAAPVSSTQAWVHFACSSPAVRIIGRRKFLGVLPMTVATSPADRSGLLAESARALPEFEQDENGVVRRPVSHPGDDSRLDP